MFTIMNLVEYQEQILNYLEYLGYPDYVTEFEPVDVARAISNAAIQFYSYNVSVRMAALTIFGLTWVHQISVINNSVTKH